MGCAMASGLLCGILQCVGCRKWEVVILSEEDECGFTGFLYPLSFGLFTERVRDQSSGEREGEWIEKRVVMSLLFFRAFSLFKREREG